MYTPIEAIPHETLLPIFVWLYGGGYVGGDKYEATVASTIGLYNGSEIAANEGELDVFVVLDVDCSRRYDRCGAEL